eukprot:gb/GECG01005817.1/.p1 GENE.gb/GECG01005817.1/~~gb/GECG01005817.1/.p1  ORF type:complete len:820 (+),score=142.47 gb/GECG01005817.1/:1-2460(+)
MSENTASACGSSRGSLHFKYPVLIGGLNDRDIRHNQQVFTATTGTHEIWISSSKQQETNSAMGKNKKQQKKQRQTQSQRQGPHPPVAHAGAGSSVTAMAANVMETTSALTTSPTSTGQVNESGFNGTNPALGANGNEASAASSVNESEEGNPQSNRREKEVAGSEPTSTNETDVHAETTTNGLNAREEHTEFRYERSTSSLVNITRTEVTTRSVSSHQETETSEQNTNVPYLSKEATARLVQQAKMADNQSNERKKIRAKSDEQVNTTSNRNQNSHQSREQFDYYKKAKADTVIPPAGHRRRSFKGSSRRMSQMSQEQPEGIELGPPEGVEMEHVMKDEKEDYFMNEHPAMVSGALSEPGDTAKVLAESRQEDEVADTAVPSNKTVMNDLGVDTGNLSHEQGFSPDSSSGNPRSTYVNPHLLKLYEAGLEYEARRRKMAQELGKEYTFSPQTNTRKNRDEAHTSPEQTSQRLYSQAKELQVKRNYARPEETTYRFSPQINREGAKYKKLAEQRKGKAIHDHLYSEAKSQRERLEEKKKSYMMKECTFEPELTTKAWKKRLSAPPAERLHTSGDENTSTKKKVEDPQSKECTFRPKINRVKQKEKQGVRPPPVHERLYSEHSKKTEEMLERKKSEEEKAMRECTFKPKLHPQPAGASHSVLDAYTRLYEHAKEKQRRDSSSSVEAHPFKPMISPASKKTAPRRSVGEESRWEQLYREGKLKVHTRNTDSPPKEDITDDDRVNCTFQPNKYGNADYRVSHKDQRFMEELPVHDRLYQHARNVQAVKELTLSGDMPFVEQEVSEQNGGNTVSSAEEQSLYLI